MKIIHCADLHLASALETSLSAEKARQRRNEILIQFSNLIRYAQQQGVRAVLIAGDLFDSVAVPARTAERVFDMMRGASDILFFYLRGNHDCVSVLPEGENIFVVPQNGQWVYYDMDQVTVALCDPAPTQENYANALALQEGRINIAVLHGEVRPSGKTVGSQIALPDFAGKNISYLALGHYHGFRADALDDYGVYCYSGCLEGRGFDECGQKGFVMLDVNADSFTYEFVPFSTRCLHDLQADLSGCENMRQMEEAVLAAVSAIPEGDMVRLTLVGALPADVRCDTEYLQSLLSGKFFAVRLHEKLRVLIDPADYQNDLSLKGMFVGSVLQSDLDEEEKQRVLSLGLHMILGGEVNV